MQSLHFFSFFFYSCWEQSLKLQILTNYKLYYFIGNVSRKSFQYHITSICLSLSAHFLFTFSSFFGGHYNPNHQPIKTLFASNDSHFRMIHLSVYYVFVCVYYRQKQKNITTYLLVPQGLAARIWTQFERLCRWAQPNVASSSPNDAGSIGSCCW